VALHEVEKESTMVMLIGTNSMAAIGDCPMAKKTGGNAPQAFDPDKFCGPAECAFSASLPR